MINAVSTREIDKPAAIGYILRSAPNLRLDYKQCLPNRKEVRDSGLAILTCYCCLQLLLSVRYSLYDNQTLSPGSG